MVTRIAPIGSGSSWQPENEIMNAWSIMRHSKAATGGWSRFETKTAVRAVMNAVLNEILPSQRKRRAARIQAFLRFFQ